MRLLFAFDPRREAIFLVAGDTSCRWDTWYRHCITTADQRFDDHLRALQDTPPDTTGHGREGS